MKFRYFCSILLCSLSFFSANVWGQLVTDNAFLQGHWLECAIAPNGSWGNSVTAPAGYHIHTGGDPGYTDPILGSTPSNSMDFNFDYQHDGFATGSFTSGPTPWFGPYYMPGTPFDGWAMQINGVYSSGWYSAYGFENESGGTLTGSVTGYTNAGGRITGTWTGTAGPGSGLQITQANRLDTNASWLVVTTKFVNTSSSVMPAVYYFVSADPDNDVTDSGGTYSTINHISYQGDYYNRHEVKAIPTDYEHHGNDFTGLCTKDCRAKALIYTGWATYPDMDAGDALDSVWNRTGATNYYLSGGMDSAWYGLGYTAPSNDIAYGLIFNIGDIGPGDSAILSFAWIFTDTTAIDSAFPAPVIVAAGGPAADSLDTVNGCEITGSSFNAQILNSTDKDWSWSTWTWAPALGLSATTGVSVTINMLALSGPTSYTITGTDTAAGSMQDCHAKVLYLYVLPCFFATNNGPICLYDTLRLNALGDSVGDTYYWYGPGGYTAFTKRATRTGMTMADTGLYYVVRTNGTVHDTVSTDVQFITTPVVTATNNGPVCSGSTLSFSALPDSVGETFTWTGPDGFHAVGEYPSIPSVNTQYTGLYKVVTNLRGCVDSTYVEATVDSTPAVPMASNNSPLCSQRSPSLTLTGNDATPGVHYNWSGPDGFTSNVQDPVLPSLSTSMSGVYSVSVSITYADLTCSNSAVTTVTIDSTPVLPILGTLPVVCSGLPLDLTATDTAGSIYNWVGPDGFIANVQNPVRNPAIVAYTGTYSVTATFVYTIPSVLGCISDTATIFATIDSTPAAPTATNNSPGTPSICQGDTLFLTGSDTSSPIIYIWTGPNSYSSTGANSILANVSPSAIGQYTLTTIFYGIPSCAATAVTTVSITPTPSLSATSNSPVCTGIGDTLFLKAISDPSATFNWSGPYTFRSTAQYPFRDPVIMEYGGIYKVTAYLNNCASAEVSDTVVVNQTPPMPWVKWITYCQNYPAPELQASGDSILWYATAAANGIGSLTPPIPSTAEVGNTFYYASQTLHGCTSAIDSIQVSVFPLPTVTVPHDTELCPNDSVLLTAVDLDPVAYYHWLPSMYLSDTSMASTMVHPVTNVTYTVVVTNQFGCMDTATVVVNVLPAAVLDLGDSVLLYPGQSYQINSQTNCTSFIWFPPSGLDNPYLSNPTASPALSTKYVVVGNTQWGCTARDSINVYVTTQSLMSLPNAFTPGNGPNNLFKIILQGEATLNSFTVFDRWGVKVFETSDINAGWDGTFNETAQPQGVYIYQINAVSSSGQSFSKSGNVTLLR